MVNGFDFPDFYEPAFNVFGGRYQNTMPLVKNKSIKVLLLIDQMSQMGSNKLKLTGKSFSEAIILASVNPKYDKRLFI